MKYEISYFSANSCKLSKWVFFIYPKIMIVPRLKKDDVQKNNNYVFNFEEGEKNLENRIASISYTPPKYQNKKELTYTLDKYLDKKNENYWLFLSFETIVFSMKGIGKNLIKPHNSLHFLLLSLLPLHSLDSLSQEGYIRSVKDPVTVYLSELKNIEGYWNELTIEHLLNMRSGIDFDEEDYVRPNSDISLTLHGKERYEADQENEI